jgi:hypothetical protein
MKSVLQHNFVYVGSATLTCHIIIIRPDIRTRGFLHMSWSTFDDEKIEMTNPK